MYFRDYIIVMAPYTHPKMNSAKLTKFIFEIAGSEIKGDSLRLDTTKTWISPRKTGEIINLRLDNYFPSHRIKENELVQYLLELIGDNWKELQNRYSEKDNHGVIDVNTDDKNVFFWSMMNQFQKCLDIPISKRNIILSENIKTEESITEGASSFSEDSTKLEELTPEEATSIIEDSVEPEVPTLDGITSILENSVEPEEPTLDGITSILENSVEPEEPTLDGITSIIEDSFDPEKPTPDGPISLINDYIEQYDSCCIDRFLSDSSNYIKRVGEYLSLGKTSISSVDNKFIIEPYFDKKEFQFVDRFIVNMDNIIKRCSGSSEEIAIINKINKYITTIIEYKSDLAKLLEQNIRPDLHKEHLKVYLRKLYWNKSSNVLSKDLMEKESDDNSVYSYLEPFLTKNRSILYELHESITSDQM